MFKNDRTASLLGLARTEYALKNFKEARKLLVLYIRKRPLNPEPYYLLGRICEKGREFGRAEIYYKNAIQLGYGGLDVLSGLLQVSSRLNNVEKNVRLVSLRYRELKRAYLKSKSDRLKKGKKKAGSRQFEERMRAFEKKLHKSSGR